MLWVILIEVTILIFWVFFATLVILSHFPELIDGNRDREILTQLFYTISFGEFVVDDFFILSGYLIVKSYYLNENPFIFLRKITLRIYPRLIVVSILCVFLVGIIGADDADIYIYNIIFLKMLFIWIPLDNH